MNGLRTASGRATLACGLLIATSVVGACGGRTGFNMPRTDSIGSGGSAGALGAAGRGNAGRGGTSGSAGSVGVGGTVGKGGFGGTGGVIPMPCSALQVKCGDACVDISSDAANCGACGQKCASGEVCEEGTCTCSADELAIESVAPKNAANSVSQSEVISARFNCKVDAALARPENARLYGGSSGYIAGQFPTLDRRNELWLDPIAAKGRRDPFFAGERVTAWLGEKLAGPYLWQFTAAVSKDSPGVFRATTQAFPGLTNVRNTTFADLDSDGDLELLVDNVDALFLFNNLGKGTFSKPTTLPFKGAPTVGDVDKDGDLDIAVESLIGLRGQRPAGRMLLNDGRGQFTLGRELPGCVAMNDLDGDGDLDCVANVGYTYDKQPSTPQGRVLFNNGSGVFSAGPEAEFGFDCDIADLDADADLDVVCISPVVEGIRVFLNDGHGVFAWTGQALGEAGARDLATGDVDNDGDVDVLETHWNGPHPNLPNIVWLNDGKGRFSNAGSFGRDGGDVQLADIDGDGDLDALVSELTTYLNPPFNPIRIYLNDAAGHFSQNGQTLGDPAVQWFKLGDVDSDGDLDAVIYHYISSSKYYGAVWVNEK